MRNLLILIMCCILISCKKESTKQVIPKEITWEDTQPVRILKVEQTVSPNSFPFDIDDLMTVEYEYSEGLLTKIIVHRSGEIHVYPRIISEDNKYEFDLSQDPKYSNIFSWKSSLLNMYNGKISSSHKIYGLPFGLGIEAFKDFYYTYGKNGLLNNIKGTSIWREGGDSSTILKETELKVGNHENVLLKAYSLKNYLREYDPISGSGQLIGRDFSIKATYQVAQGVPDGLVRIVNQNVLGLSRIGFEDYQEHAQYDFLVGSRLISEGEQEAHATAVVKYRYTFADWIVSFGLNDAFVIPSQGNHLIASKHITGKKLVDGEYEYDADDFTDRLINPIYSSVDSTANYPYTHNATNKTLEIAGLKIWYELVE